METGITVVHFVVAIVIIGLILLQQGKGASMGASLGGGGSNTVFGSSGGASFFAKLTGVLALIFFLTSLGMTLIARNNAQIQAEPLIPVIEAPAEIPVVEDISTPSLPVDAYETE